MFKFVCTILSSSRALHVLSFLQPSRYIDSMLVRSAREQLFIPKLISVCPSFNTHGVAESAFTVRGLLSFGREHTAICL